MAEMTEQMQKMLNNAKTAILATSSPEGIPNAVPVGAKKILDRETVLISDQFLNKTLENLKSNPRASLTYWEDKKGYQLKGSITIETTGKRFEETAEWIEKIAEKTGMPLKSKGAVILSIEEIYAIGPGPESGRRLA